MDTKQRADTLLEVLRQGFQITGERQAQAILGNRNAYIGMSDIGRYAECPRAALAAKLLPPDTTLERLLPLQRGHWFEDGVGQCLVGLGLHVLPQLEIRHTFQGTPIKAHLDFTLVWTHPKPAVRILEIKSMAQIPDRPYDAHALQAQGQTALLCESWDKPVFTYRNENGTKMHENVSFPQLCRKRFGMELPTSPQGVSVEGWLLCLSMKDAQAFGPYGFDPDALDRVQWTARDFWEDMQAIRANALALDAVPYAQGYHPLCACCRVNADCPKFPQGDFQPQWEPAIAKLDALKQRRSALDAEIKEVELALKQAHSLSGTHDWISTGQHRFRMSVTNGRRILDEAALKEEMDEICAVEHIDPIDIIAMLRSHEREGMPSARLTVAHLN